MGLRSYILPREMEKAKVDARMRKDETDMTQGGTGMEVRSQHKTETEAEEKNLEAFKFSMLKASLDYESGFVGAAHVPPPSKSQFHKQK